MKPFFLSLCVMLLCLSSFHTTNGMECWNGCSYQCWNSKANGVEHPSHFLIDVAQERIVLTAKNSVCHISLDLRVVDNVRNVTPSPDTLSACTGDPHYEDPDKCHNYHHILLLPVAPGNDTMVGDSATPLDNTILECGSNAFSPKCNYRMRTNLSSVSMVDGADYVPDDGGYSHTTSLWLSTGHLVSATPLSVGEFGLVISGSPYNGPIQVGTVSSWFDRSVQFVSMYEIDEYIYTFFREDPDETTQEDIYSRVSRVCKNDMGVTDTDPFPLDYNIFTTFLKARLTCVSTGDNTEPPYYYNELQDTFLIESENGDGSVERSLYGVFTSPENGPVGSAVCVYSFGAGSEENPTLESVFDGDYLIETSHNQFDKIENTDPVTCSSERDADDADSNHLMFQAVRQATHNKPHLQLTGYSFRKILVTTAVDLSGSTHDVMYITTSKDGALLLLKAVYDSAEEKPHIISEEEIKLSETTQSGGGDLPRVIHMEFLGNGSDVDTDAVFVGTTEGLYRFPLATCARFSQDCCGCVSARDPHCGHDPYTNECVVVGDGETHLLQDVAGGDVGVCSRLPGSGDPPTTDPSVTTDTNIHASLTVSVGNPSPTILPITPSVGGVTKDESSQNYLWTIIAAVFSFTGGVVLGILAMAFCYKNKGRFVWSKLVSPRRPTTVQPQPRQPASNKGATNKELSGAAEFSKAEDYERNNSDMNPHGNPTNIVHIDPISNLPYSKHHHGNGSNNKVTPAPPPYTPNKPHPLPGKCEEVTSPETTSEKTTPTMSHHSTPEHRTPEKKLNKTPPTLALALSMPPKSTTPPSAQATHPQSSPLTLTPVGVHPVHRHPYHRAHSHTQGPPLSGHYSTLPSKKKRHSSSSQSEATPTKRPSSAEVPPDVPLTRPASAQNLSHAHRTRGVATVTTPTKHRPMMVPTTPFSATPYRGVVPSSPYGGGSSSSAGTPSSAGGTPRFKFPPTKLPPESGVPQWRGEGGRNPNVKATGYAVEPTSNQERAMYGHNMVARMHTIDRKNKLQNGHAHRGRSPPVTVPHPETTVIEVDGGLVGCTDC